MGIVLVLSFLGFFVCLILLIISAIRKQPIKPFAIGMAVCFVVFLIVPSQNTDAGDASTPKTEANQPKQVAAQQEPDFEDTLTELANDSLKNSKVPISVNFNDGACVVHCQAPTSETAYFNEVDLVRSHLSAYIKFCIAAYDTGDVSSVDWWAETTMIDSKGNESIGKVVQFKMPKETFETYNWENMEYRPGMFQQFSEDCTVCYVHPGLLKNINTEEKLFYAP